MIGVLSIEYQLGRLTRLAVFSVTALISAMPIIMTFLIFAPEFLQTLIEPFQNAIDVVLFGIETGEPSADARLFQTMEAWPMIIEHWLLGVGFLSARWNEGFLGQFTYFYPTDIGLLGALFVYGMLGMVIYLFVPYLAWKVSRCTPCRVGPLRIPYIASVAWLTYSFSLSVSTGFFIFSPAPTLFFIFLVGEMRRATLRRGVRW
ncbi:O-antigen ligase family protein [Sulfitobacter sediminilitoris]|uniref:O-antigen ligase family protein n=1 Tax=Sulfitobacter sediminilitoris TaxID=2698830 RepID=UPI0036172FF1